MSKEFYDVLIVVPLEQELEALYEFFPHKTDLTKENLQISQVESGNILNIIVVHQDIMGKTGASSAMGVVLKHYNVGIVICIGIAGGLSKDLKIGDVCYSGTIIDVLDNNKVSDIEAGLDIELSPTHYITSASLTSALNFSRTNPTLRKDYIAWQDNQGAYADLEFEAANIPMETRNLLRTAPISLNGVIVCGAVTKSAKYNSKLRNLDRAVLAVETESGGIFNVANLNKVASCLTIRGISDLADKEKNELEAATKGLARKCAAANAVGFLHLQMKNPYFLETLRKIVHSNPEKLEYKSQDWHNAQIITSAISDQENLIEEKLRELAPDYKITKKGYKLPLPRIQEVPFGDTSNHQNEPIELIDALANQRCIFINIPRTYPDNSLPWVFAKELLGREIYSNQLFPVVIDGDSIRPPKFSLNSQSKIFLDKSLANKAGVKFIYIIYAPNFTSTTRTSTLVSEINSEHDSNFIIVSRSDEHISHINDFINAVSATNFNICKISFRQIAYFVEKNFSLPASEAEVIALRLKNTFDRYDLSAHPTYFAGIPQETLAALLY